ncbi:unnamed protein product [Moneuplotes crassus]|uniref:Uncharacterized protein n=1 Tax=Euplotes crassus TaxID=5936 RepID=A0AAD1Y5T7_EUPCR|nr:unnamed protein product [Moneuplotes crassus]
MNEVNTKVKEAIAETNKSMEIVEKDIIRTLNNSISTISSKIMKEVQFKLNNKEAVTMEELEEKLKHKVGNAEFMHELDLKSNKNDTNTAMNSIEILHKQNKNICGIVMEALKQAADYFINTDESEKTLYEKRAQLHKHALRVSKWVDMFSPNDISILQKEYKDLNSIFTHRSNKNHSKRKCKRRLNLSENFESHGNKLSPDNLMTKSCKNGILNQSTESKQKILNTERDEVEDLLSALPSVKNINKSLIMQNIIAPKTKRKVANSIQINKKQLFKIQKRNQIFRNHKRSICLQEDLDNQSLIKTNQAP